jgi:hypothetical protein
MMTTRMWNGRATTMCWSESNTLPNFHCGCPTTCAWLEALQNAESQYSAAEGSLSTQNQKMGKIVYGSSSFTYLKPSDGRQTKKLHVCRKAKWSSFVWTASIRTGENDRATSLCNI